MIEIKMYMIQEESYVGGNFFPGEAAEMLDENETNLHYVYSRRRSNLCLIICVLKTAKNKEASVCLYQLQCLRHEMPLKNAEYIGLFDTK